MNQVAALNRTLRAIFWTALALGLVAMSLGVRQVDLWWQLPDGLAILATHHLPVAPTTAFGMPAVPYIDEYSLYEIGLAALDQIGGLGAIHVVFAAAFLLIFALPFTPAARAPRDLVSGALVTLAALFIINRFEQRPEIIGVLLLVLLIRLLLRTRQIERAFLLRLTLLLAVWTGVHSSYLIGLFALALWLVQRLSCRDSAARWAVSAGALTFAIACAAVLVNPYGAERIAFTFSEQRDLGSNLLSPEMWPAWDQAAGVQRLMVLAAGVIGWALASRQRPPLWLGALAVALFVLTLFNIRHMSFLAGALLYLATQRRVAASGPRWNVALVPLLAASCIAALLFDFVALRGAVSALRAPPSDNVRRFAPTVAASAGGDEASSILCHDDEGSYLTFARPNLHPFMDSGQGHFADATKRIYFFAIYDADSFDRTLEHLPNVGSVLVTAQVEVWTLAMASRPGWHLDACDDNGLLFRRSVAGADESAEIGHANATTLAQARDHAIARDDLMHAFCFSALIDPPAQSLRLLDRSRADDWTERFYSFTRAWLHRLAPGDVETFLDAEPRPVNSLLAELMLERGPTDAPLPPLGPTDLEHLARVVTLLDRKQTAEAAALLRSTRKPLASPLYYTLRGQLDPEADRHAPAAERWQDWNDGGATLLDAAFPRLDARAAAQGESPVAR